MNIPRTFPTRERELALLEKQKTQGLAHPVVAGIDEVGRGALAGPVSVGVALIDGTEGEVPPGLTDSKQVTARKRELLFPQVASWVADWEVASASAAEIDQWGITVALRLAANRGLQALAARGWQVREILLDGSHNWLQTPPADLFLSSEHPDAGGGTEDERQITTVVKGDNQICVISAASILAKVTRDRHLATLPDPGYDWAHNKGYASPKHIAALRQLGPGEYHRKTWRLPK